MRIAFADSSHTSFILDYPGTTASIKPAPGLGVDFSPFKNLWHLRLGIQVYPTSNSNLTLSTTHIPTYHAYTQSHIPPYPNYTPNPLFWLTQALDTIPYTLSHLIVKIAVDKRVFNGTGAESEADWRALVNKLRSLRSRNIRVKLSVHMTSSCSGFTSSLVSAGSGFATGFGMPMVARGRGRGRTRLPGSGFVGGLPSLDGQDCESAVGDESNTRRWIEGLFQGLDVKFI